MKKLLAVLGSITLVTSSSFTVVSCFGGTTEPEKEKTNWSDEEILERFGSLEINELENGDLELSSKEDHFKIWSGSSNGNKYERIVKKDDVENNNVNFLYDSLLPTDASLEKPFGMELMSGFYVGKSEDEIKKAFLPGHNKIVLEFGSEMTNDNHWNIKKKNAFSIFLGSEIRPISSNTFSCTRLWKNILKVKTNQGEDIYIGLISLYVDYFVGYVTNNLSTWMKEFFEEYSSQLNSPDLEIEEVVNEKDKIIANSKNQHLNLKLYNANFKFDDEIEYTIEGEIQKGKISYELESSIYKKIRTHYKEFNSKYENSIYKDFIFGETYDFNDPIKDKKNHFNIGSEIWGPDDKRWDYNSIIYTKIDIINS
ncbi:lipoprotein [Spiroplasma endosymbiont of Cantharis rufa]|uniref:lipoprotein n=1 Tax=Spiroplasma endosymbiont of Cantharis rufa TaxID=3066279 RepID=UPI0030D5B8F8